MMRVLKPVAQYPRHLYSGDESLEHRTHGTCTWEAHAYYLILIVNELCEIHNDKPELTLNVLWELHAFGPALTAHCNLETDSCKSVLMVHVLCETQNSKPRQVL